jgi:hypothetical protein
VRLYHAQRVSPQWKGFIDPVIVELRTHRGADRLMRVARRFRYIDRFGIEHEVPEGVISDGATIPRPLWWFGHPLMGDYRRAAILHDKEVQFRDHSSIYAHWLFKDAMLADQVRLLRADLMYRAVARFGPQWEGGELGGCNAA